MGLVGSILGDIAGSPYEFGKSNETDYKNSVLFTDKCTFTDDTVMTLATKYAILNDTPFEDEYRNFFRRYPHLGYGKMFIDWANADNAPSYNSYGNGSAMRVSCIGEMFDRRLDVIYYARKSAFCTHSHPEGIKGAIITAMCVNMAKYGYSKQDIFKYVKDNYPSSKYKYSVEYSLDNIRPTYEWDITCQGSVPVAIRCFLESDDYMSCLRNVFSLNCDTDTLCCIAGGIAESFYKTTGLNNDELLSRYLDSNLYNILKL
jgi:ADP-ribosylglycohydrolase